MNKLTDIVDLAIEENQPNRYQHSKEYEELWMRLAGLDEIEEELGIDFVTLFKALGSECIFIKRDGKIYECGVALTTNIDENGWFFDLDVCHLGQAYFKDYGKTWALTREELE